MTEPTTIPNHCDDIMVYARELSTLLHSIRDGFAYYDGEAGEFRIWTTPDEQSESPHDPATLFDWIDQQLDLTVLYERATDNPPHFKYVPAYCEILITCGGPTVRLTCRDGWAPELYHSWGWFGDSERDTVCIDKELGDWIIEELQEVYGG